MSQLVQPSELDPTTFEEGVRCADCGTLLVDRWGRPVAPLWERRTGAAPLLPGERETDDPEEVAWIWTLICAECAA